MLASVTIDNRAGFPALLSMVSRDYISEEHSKREFDGESCDDELL